MILAQKSSPVPSSRRISLAPLPRRGCLVLPVPRRSPEPSPAPRSRAEPPPALGRIEQRDLIHRLSIKTKFQFQFKRESRVQVPQLILKIQNRRVDFHRLCRDVSSISRESKKYIAGIILNLFIEEVISLERSRAFESPCCPGGLIISNF